MPRPLRRERISERARFSSIVMSGAVPARGSWNTRPMERLRTYSRCLVTSRSPSVILPSVSANVPATALSSVDLPEPFEPMMLTNWPAGTSRSTPASATTSLAVPGKKTLRTPAQPHRLRRAHARTTLRRTVGIESATTTSTAVSSLRSVGSMPRRRLTAISRR